jgi:hypothetical protein
MPDDFFAHNCWGIVANDPGWQGKVLRTFAMGDLAEHEEGDRLARRDAMAQSGLPGGKLNVSDESPRWRTMPYRQIESYTSEQLAQDPPLTGISHSLDFNYAASVYQPNAVGGVMTNAIQNIGPYYNYFMPYSADANRADPYHELMSSYSEPGAFSTDLPSNTGVQPHLESLKSYNSFRGLPTDSTLPTAAPGATLQPTDRQGKWWIQPNMTEDVEASHKSDPDDSLAIDFTAQTATLHPDLSLAGLSSTQVHRQEDSKPHTTRFEGVNSTLKSPLKIIRYQGEDVDLEKRKLGVEIANQKVRRRLAESIGKAR